MKNLIRDELNFRAELFVSESLRRLPPAGLMAYIMAPSLARKAIQEALRSKYLLWAATEAIAELCRPPVVETIEILDVEYTLIVGALPASAA